MLYKIHQVENSYTATISVPIVGWNSNFNPLLSMPLVNIGRDSESLILQDPIISTSATQRVHYGTVLDDTDYDGDLFTYDNSTSTGLKITFNQNTILFMILWQTPSFFFIRGDREGVHILWYCIFSIIHNYSTS